MSPFIDLLAAVLPLLAQLVTTADCEPSCLIFVSPPPHHPRHSLLVV